MIKSRVFWPKVKGFKSKTILLSRQVVDYIKADQIFINNIWKRGEQEADKTGPRFPELEKIINEILDDYESVFIKLNWRAPMDLQREFPNLKFSSMYDIFLALKTSGIISELIEEHDQQLYKNKNDQCQLINAPQEGYILELRKYYILDPLKEYRCFVKNNRLVAVSQRNLYLINQIDKLDMLNKIQNFINQIENIQDDVIDIYQDITDKFIAVDINPWYQHTRPKLFTYEELENIQEVQIRIVENKDQIIQESYDEYKQIDEMNNIDDLEEMMKQL
ncbi:hypothetical protein pb186bvf_007632 [Paramecium bursaria]